MVKATGVRYTKHGYRCNNCHFNFVFDLTSPDTKCPKCGDVINDKIAYYICRALRAFVSAFVITWLLFVLEYMYTPKTFPLVSLAVLIPLTGVLVYKQIWSLILIRIIYRALIITAVVLLIFALFAWAVSALNIYKPDGPIVVALALIISLVLTLISYIAFRINGKTYDYVADGPIV